VASHHSLSLCHAGAQARVTAAGEYLMTLPQTLEALLAAGEAAGGDAAGGVDAEWLDRARPAPRRAALRPLAPHVARWPMQRCQE
jgi:hypothetical protein